MGIKSKNKSNSHISPVSPQDSQISPTAPQNSQASPKRNSIHEIANAEKISLNQAITHPRKLYSVNMCNQCLFWETNEKGAIPTTFLWKLRKIRKQTHILFDHSEHLDMSTFLGKVSKSISWSIMIFIIVSTIAFVLQSMPELRMENGEEWDGWDGIDVVVSIAFTLEYVIRFSCSRNQLNFIFSILNIIDLLAILPFFTRVFVDEVCLYFSILMFYKHFLYLFIFIFLFINKLIQIVFSHYFFLQYAFKKKKSQITSTNTVQLRVLRVVRLARIFRLLKMSRHSKYLQLFTVAIYKSMDAFGLLIFILSVSLIVFSSLLYFAG